MVGVHFRPRKGLARASGRSPLCGTLAKWERGLAVKLREKILTRFAGSRTHTIPGLLTTVHTHLPVLCRHIEEILVPNATGRSH